MAISTAFIRYLEVVPEKIADRSAFPFCLPLFQKLERIDLDPHVTFFVGENGTGKSTLIEAIAMAAGMNPEGGSRNYAFRTYASESPLHQALRLVRGVKRPRSDFFLRAESFFNLATEIERLDAERGMGPPLKDAFGGRNLHTVSHGEAFMAMANNRLRADGLYLFDEPEAALSPQRQLALLARMSALVKARCQLIIATHSPILMAYPGARIYLLSAEGIEQVEYEQTEHYALTRDFLNERERYLARVVA